MIQRIQSLYLFVIVILFTSLLFTPLADISLGDQLYQLNAKGIVSVTDGTVIQNTFLLTAIEGLVLLIALISIFLFKKRIIQIRLSIFNTVLMIGFYAMLGIYLYVAKTGVNLDFNFRITVTFPFIAAILNYLAIRAIGKDEALVRSLNRIR